MKIIRDRREFGQSVNFGRYPVVYAKAERNEYGWCLGKVRIDIGREYFLRAQLWIYSDEHRLTTSSAGTCLAERFGYREIVDDAMYASSPVLKPNSQFVLVLDAPEQRKAICLLVDTGKVRLNCSEPLQILDADMEPVLDAMGMTAELFGAGE